MKNKKLKTKIIGLALASIAPLALVGGFALSGIFAKADDEVKREWHETTNLVDLNSFGISGDYQDTPLTSWTVIPGYDVNSVGKIIDVSDKIFSSNHTRQFFLEHNPNKLNQQADNKILMINSQYSTTSTPHAAKRGYRSNEFTLKSNSYYKLSVDAATTTDGLESVKQAYGSIYLTGIKNGDEDVKVAYEGFSGNWQTYEFFIATGSEDQTVTLDLYLGQTDTQGSYGAVLYDEIQVEQFSQNAFMADAINNFGYQFHDYLTTTDKNTKFLVSGLIEDDLPLMEREDYKAANLDFENQLEGNYLTHNWDRIDTTYSNAHARIYNVIDGKTAFEEDTGYKFVGNDFSYSLENRSENTQALTLYTDKGTRGKITLENTTPIKVEAHAVYKINMKVKASSFDGDGAFYVSLVEGDKILSTYNLKETDIGGLKTGTSSGFSSNTTSNEVQNNYSDLSFYVVGRTFYDSEVKLRLSLGNDTSDASGCVFVDNITIDYATSAQASDADNVLYLDGTDETTYSDIKNAYFNDVEVESTHDYPLKAKNWTLTQPTLDQDNVAAGVIYLHNQEKYEEMYDEMIEKDGALAYKYAWSASYPGNPRGYIDAPNNVYMMYNADDKAYQSLQSENYTLNANSYYKLTFAYQIALGHSQITVEVVDDNGIVLFKKLMPNSLGAGIWNNETNIQFHTALTSSHNISVKIHFGTEGDGNGAKGIVYLDDFEIAQSTQEAFDSAQDKVDLTGYMLNLDPDGTIASSRTVVSSSAYSFSNPGEANTAFGGIVNGKDNEYEVVCEDENGDAKNMLALISEKSNASLTSNFPFSLSTDQTYYKLTFSLYTKMTKKPNVEIEDGHECKYGVNIGLTNFTLAQNLLSDNKWTDYTIYFKATTASESKLQFELNMDEHFKGCVFLTDIDFSNATQQQFDDAASDTNPNKDTVLTSTYSQSEDETPPVEDDTEEETSTTNNSNWIVIPSLITALAVLIGIIGFAFRHVKIKKVEKVREEEYNRRISLNHEEIASQAREEQDKQVAEIKANIAAMQEQKQILDDEHKLATKDARLSGKGKITKETEREFKSYAARLTRLEQKIDILNEQLAKVESKSYRESLERKIATEESKRQREAIKKAEEQSKEKEKQAKKDSK